MVIRRSHFVSLCLLGLAASIAISEYCLHTPADNVASGDLSSKFEDENDLLASDDSTEMSDQNETASDDSDIIEIAKNPKVPVVKTDNDSEKPLQNNNKLQPTSNEQKVILQRGDTLGSILTDLGFNNNDIHNGSKAVMKVFKLRGLKIGQEIIIRAEKDADDNFILKEIEFSPTDLVVVKAIRNEDGTFFGEKKEIPIKKIVKTASGVLVPSNAVVSLEKTGLKQSVAKDAVRALGHVVNLRSIKELINYEFLYKDSYDMSGKAVGRPELIYASALVNGKIFRTYKFKLGNTFEYVDQTGKIVSRSNKGSMLARPLNHMRVTSGYGMRMHPVHGYSKRHTGIDLGASTGTPIYAAASGTVSMARYYAGYGKYVKIKHPGNIETAYGHMSRICVRSGQYVKQGQILGYVGKTGIATASHLHYEVKKNGKFVNPSTFVKVPQQKLEGKDLRRFNQMKRDINIQIVGLTSSVKGTKRAKVRKIS